MPCLTANVGRITLRVIRRLAAIPVGAKVGLGVVRPAGGIADKVRSYKEMPCLMANVGRITLRVIRRLTAIPGGAKVDLGVGATAYNRERLYALRLARE